MKNKRMFGVLAFVLWWGIWGALLTGIPFTLGNDKIYSADQGCGTVPYVGFDIKNVQRLSMKDFCSFIYGNQPSRGPKGTTFDMLKRKEVPQVASIAHNTSRFGSPEMVEGFWGPVNPQKAQLPDKETLTKFVKDCAKYFGAIDVGIADLGRNPEIWFFEDDSFGYPIKVKPEEHRYAIVCITEEKGLPKHPYPTDWSIESIGYYGRLAKAYYEDDYVAGHVAEMIRMMGYHAWGHNNAYIRSVPVAVLAGCGEYGRFGNLITASLGANARICAVTTDLSLVPDKPISLGVRDICSSCTRCVDYCPTKAIGIEEIDYMGFHTWKPNFWRCRRSSAVGIPNMVDASTCTLCRDVCPFSKDVNKYPVHLLGRVMVTRSSIGRRFILNLDYLLYSRWNRHNLQQMMTERRALLREANAKYPEGDWSNSWFGLGATDVKGRRIYREKNPLGIIAVPRGGVGLFHPFYTKEDLENPTFGKWPSWEDPWGRKVAGYEDGKDGAPRLNLRPTVKVVGTAVLSGIAGSPMVEYALKKMPPEEAVKQEPDTWCGAGFDTACSPRAGSYAW